MRKVLFLLTFLAALGLASKAYAPVVVDVPSSKNELIIKGSSPHVKFIDESGTGNFQILVNEKVLKLDSLQLNSFFNVPNDGTFGIELNPPSTITVTPFLAGGSLVDGTYYIKITALDVGGETVGSAEQTCVISGGGGSGRCYCAWVAVPPPAANYRVYVGTSPGAENKYFSTGGAIVYNLTTTVGTSGTPPQASTAYQVKLKNDGIHFPDGSSQLTAAGTGAWQFAPWPNILNTVNGNVGIYDGSVFTPDAKLTIKCLSSPCGIDVNDSAAFTEWNGTVQMRSNYKISTDRLWDTLKSSWVVSTGATDGDAFKVWRAPATGGAPAYSVLLTLSSGGSLVVPNAKAFDSDGDMLAIEEYYESSYALACDGTDRLLNIGGSPSHAYAALRNHITASTIGTISCSNPSAAGTVTIKLKRDSTVIKTTSVSCAGNGMDYAPATVPYGVTLLDLDYPGPGSYSYYLTASCLLLPGFSATHKSTYVVVHQIP